MSKIERAMIEEARAKNDSDSPPQLTEGLAKFVIKTECGENGSLRSWLELVHNDLLVHKWDAHFLRPGDTLTYEVDIPLQVTWS